MDKLYLEKYVKYKNKYLILKKQNLLYGGEKGSCDLCFNDDIELEECVFNCNSGIFHKFCTQCTLRFLLSIHISNHNIRCPKCQANTNNEKILEFTNKICEYIPQLQSQSQSQSESELQSHYSTIIYQRINSITSSIITPINNSLDNFHMNRNFMICCSDILYFIFYHYFVRLIDFYTNKLSQRDPREVLVISNDIDPILEKISLALIFYPYINLFLAVINIYSTTNRIDRWNSINNAYLQLTKSIRGSFGNHAIYFSMERVPFIIRLMLSVTDEEQNQFITSLLQRIMFFFSRSSRGGNNGNGDNGNNDDIDNGNVDKDKTTDKLLNEYRFNIKIEEISKLLIFLKEMSKKIENENKINNDKFFFIFYEIDIHNITGNDSDNITRDDLDKIIKFNNIIDIAGTNIAGTNISIKLENNIIHNKINKKSSIQNEA